MNNRVCVIVPYFGKFPNYFKFWLRSCEYNTVFDWIIITDNNLISKSQNIIVHHYTWEAMQKLAQSKFDFDIALNRPYKLCDFKPAYGYIFQEVIGGYDFWGYCDADIIWGDLKAFITDDILDNYDRIFRNGHFCLYRNNDEMNKLFMQNKGLKYDYKYVFTHPESFAFDENGIPIRSRIKELLPFVRQELDPFNSLRSLGGMNTLARECNTRQYQNITFDDIRQNQYSFFSTRRVGEYTLRQSKSMPSMYSFSHGKLYRIVWTPSGLDISESMYVHFQKRPMGISTTNVDKFSIVPNRFVENQTDNKLYKKQCANKIVYWHYIKIRFRNSKRMINKILAHGKVMVNMMTLMLPWRMRR